MRRERIVAVLTVVVAAICVTVAAPGVARAASPSEICADLADGQLNGSYSAADLAAYQQALQSDPTIQGYCSPLVVVTPQCQEVPAGTAGAVLAPNGKYYANAPNGNAAACGPAGSQPQCTEVPAATPGALQAPNGRYYINAPGGNAAICGPAATTTTTTTTTTAAPAATPAAPPAPPTTGVLGATKTKAAPTKVTAVAPATKTAAPLGTTRSSGTLPFTGAQLGVFALVGAALIAGGLLLRRTGRHESGF